MISHLTPMFTPSGFRPGLHDMHDLMHDWETVTSGPVRKQMEKQQVAQFVASRIQSDSAAAPDLAATTTTPVTSTQSMPDVNTPSSTVKAPVSAPTQFVRGQERRPASDTASAADGPSWRSFISLTITSILVIIGGMLQYRRFTSSHGNKS